MRRPYERAAAVATIERTSAAAAVYRDPGCYTLSWRILVLLLLLLICRKDYSRDP